ncbi:transposase [Actinosynnema sp. NPDC023794]
MSASSAQDVEVLRPFGLVVIEGLAVRTRPCNRSSARAISDADWSDPRPMLECKCRWYGCDLVVVDRRLPGSTTCSARGRLRDRLPLHVRVWTCGCGARHDRDAARGTPAAGPVVTARGDGVRPTRR